MRLITIWSIPAMSFTERLARTRDWAAMDLAGRLPKRLRYFVTIREVAKATVTSPNIPATPLEEILKNLDRPKKLS